MKNKYLYYNVIIITLKLIYYVLMHRVDKLIVIYKYFAETMLY